MDKLTLVIVAGSQPNRAVIFSGCPDDPNPLVGCARCAMEYMDYEEDLHRFNHVRFMLMRTDLAMVTPVSPIRCGCGAPLEYT